MIDLDRFVGIEREISAHVDLETPSKRLLLKIAAEKGAEWCRDNSVDFNFVNKALVTAIQYAKEDANGETNPSVEQTQVFGFIAGVIDYITNKDIEDGNKD